MTVTVSVMIVIYVIAIIYMSLMKKYDYIQWEKDGREIVLTAIQEAGKFAIILVLYRMLTFC